jgi:hypothetical protein
MYSIKNARKIKKKKLTTPARSALGRGTSITNVSIGDAHKIISFYSSIMGDVATPVK